MINTPGASRWAAYRPSKAVWFWSCVLCVIAPITVGFSWGGWRTETAVAKLSEAAGRQARADLVAAYCVDKFQNAPNAAQRLASLKKLSEADRDEFIEKGGWTKLPGQEKAVDGAARLCAKELTTLALVNPNSA